MEADNLPSQILQQIEQVRAEGPALLNLSYSVTNSSRNLNNETENGTSLLHQLVSQLQAQEIRRRAVLEAMNKNVQEFENNDYNAVSGQYALGATTNVHPDNGRDSVENDFKVLEDSEALRMIATNSISRDISHSLNSEVTWRRNAHADACAAEQYFHEQLAKTFSSVKLPNGVGTNDPSKSDKIKSNGSITRQSLRELIASLKGIESFCIENCVSSNPPSDCSHLRRLTLHWENGLNLVVEFAPIVSHHYNTTERLKIDNNASLSLSGLRVVWIEITSRLRNHSTDATLVKEMTISVQQCQFSLAKRLGETEAVHTIIKWLEGEFLLIGAAPVKSDFLSPLHLEIN